jgi:hypothetical protein
LTDPNTRYNLLERSRIFQQFCCKKHVVGQLHNSQKNYNFFTGTFLLRYYPKTGSTFAHGVTKYFHQQPLAKISLFRR